MIFAASAHVIYDVGASVVQTMAALAPEPSPTTGPAIQSGRVVEFIAEKIAPILLAALGVIFISRASKGEMSRVLTSSAIAIMGLAFIAGATALFFFGKNLVDLILGPAS
jgi:hypothetical protein